MAIQPTRIASVDFAGGVNNLLRQFRAQEQQKLQEDSLRATTEHRNRMFDRLVANDEQAQENFNARLGFQRERAQVADARAAQDDRRADERFAFQRAQTERQNRRQDANDAFDRQAKRTELALKRAANSGKKVNVKGEQSVRKEFQALTKDFRTTRDAHSRVEASAENPSPAGDLALIFNYMKVLDPGSVVREGEFATAQNSGSIGARIRAQYNNVVKGTRLTPEQRADFLNRSRALFRGRQQQYQQTESQFRSLAERSGLNPENIVLEFGRPQSQANQPTPGGAVTIGDSTINWSVKGQ